MTLFICLLIKFLSELPLEYKVYGGRDSTCLIHHWILLAYYNIWHSGTPLQYSCLKNPWMEEPGRLQSMGSWRVGYDWATSLSLFTCMHWRRKWQPTPVFLPGESRDGGAWWAAVYGVAQSRTRLKWLSSSSSSSSLNTQWRNEWRTPFTAQICWV